MADRRMGILSEQRAESGRRSRFLQAESAPAKNSSHQQSYQQNMFQEASSGDGFYSPSSGILAKSANES